MSSKQTVPALSIDLLRVEIKHEYKNVAGTETIGVRHWTSQQRLELRRITSEHLEPKHLRRRVNRGEKRVPEFLKAQDRINAQRNVTGV